MFQNYNTHTKSYLRAFIVTNNATLEFPPKLNFPFERERFKFKMEMPFGGLQTSIQCSCLNSHSLPTAWLSVHKTSDAHRRGCLSDNSRRFNVKQLNPKAILYNAHNACAALAAMAALNGSKKVLVHLKVVKKVHQR